MSTTTPNASAHPRRLDPVIDPTPVQQELMATGMERGDQPLNIFATLAHNPGVMRKVNALGGRFLQSGTVDARSREIVILRSSYRTGSIYEFGQHTLIGADAGLTADEIARLATEDVGAGWSPLEQRLISMVDELTADDRVTDATWDGLRAELDDAQLVEALLLPGFYRMLAGFLNSAGVQLEPDAPGWPPTGEAPS